MSSRFLVGLRDISSSVEQQDATATLREVAAKYPDYNVTTFMPLWLFTDQYALIVPSTVQNIVVAMIVSFHPLRLCLLCLIVRVVSGDDHNRARAHSPASVCPVGCPRNRLH